MIPDEAVEAAAKALWDIDRGPHTREFEDCREGAKRHLRREARTVLESVVHIIDKAGYDRGYDTGWDECNSALRGVG